MGVTPVSLALSVAEAEEEKKRIQNLNGFGDFPSCHQFSLFFFLNKWGQCHGGSAGWVRDVPAVSV